MDRVRELEIAILGQAKQLATEYREGAARSRDDILREARRRLQQRERLEEERARTLAERHYRRVLQASELELQREMDLLRWNLVEGVLARLDERLRDLAGDEARYLPLLGTWLGHGAALIERPLLVAELNSRDLERLHPRWRSFSQAAAPTKRVELATTPIDTLGGVRVRSEDGRIRVDHTFEGRRERFEAGLHRVVWQRLLTTGESGHG